MMAATMFILASCARVEIKNQLWCVDLGSLGAHCANTLKSETYDLDVQTWENRRFGQFCTNDDSDKLGSQLAEMKKELEEICSIYSACTYEQVAALHNFLKDMAKRQAGLIKK